MADPDIKRKIRVKTEDGATDVIGVHTIEVTNLTLTNDGGGVVSIDTGGGGGGAVDSVNGQTGVVVLNAVDVGALPLFTTIRIAVAGGPITLADAGGVILVDTTGGPINMQLQVAEDGFQCVLINTGTNPMSIDSSVLDSLINGVGTVNVTTQYDAATLIVSTAASTAYAIGV